MAEGRLAVTWQVRARVRLEMAMVRPLAWLRIGPDDFPFRRSTVIYHWPEPIGSTRRRFWRRHRELSRG